MSRFSTRPFFMGEPGAHGGDQDDRGSGDADQTLLGDEDADRHDGGDGKNGEQQRYRLDPFHPISRRRLPLQRPKGVSGRGMRVPPFFCI
ncbi:hypothetical protein ETR37_16000 [Geobacillus sp. PK12]|nr:hypothetical protein ETR37_16000 [Geobacillus sp. PK12]